MGMKATLLAGVLLAVQSKRGVYERERDCAACWLVKLFFNAISESPSSGFG